MSSAAPGLDDSVLGAGLGLNAMIDAVDPRAVATPGLVWQHAYTGANSQSLGTGQRSIWHMTGTTWGGQFSLLQTVPPAWRIAASADFDGDGDGDLVWQNLATGDRSIWLMVGNQWQGAFALLPKVPVQWEIAAAADFTGDYKPDLIWQNLVTGDRSIWHMNGTTWPGGTAYTLLPRVAIQWRIAGAADFTGDFKPDLVWQNAYIGPAGTAVGTGQRSIWHMNGTSWSGQFTLLETVPAQWLIAAAADYTDDGKPDLVWQNVVTGQRSIWHMNGTQWPGQFTLLQTVPPQWRIATHLGGSTGPPPAAPTNLTATAVSSSQIHLAWTDNSTNETGFQIVQCTGAGCTSFTPLQTAPADHTSSSSVGLSPSTSYSFRVRAVNAGGASEYSNVATAVTRPIDPCDFASSALPIAIGGVRTGTLAETDCPMGDGTFGDAYRLVLGSATTVRIRLTSSQFDTFLLLKNSQLTNIAQDDNSGGGTNSRVDLPLAAGTYYILANSRQRAMTGQYTVSVDGADPPAGCIGGGGSGFGITLCILSPMFPSQRAAFESAASRWATLITGDLPDRVANLAAGQCGANSPALAGTPVDDVLIFAAIETIDGPGQVYGQANWCVRRGAMPALPGDLPFVGFMRFDVADLGTLEQSGRLVSLILHEMGHVLGIGTLWDMQPTPEGSPFLQDESPPGNPLDTYFNGTNAIEGFNLVGGATYTGGRKVPVENTYGGGTRNAHWRESVLANELMTGFLSSTSGNPLSALTVKSLADLGYEVAPSGWDPFFVPLTLRTERAADPGRIQLVNDVYIAPGYAIDARGRILRVR